MQERCVRKNFAGSRSERGGRGTSGRDGGRAVAPAKAQQVTARGASPAAFPWERCDHIHERKIRDVPGGGRDLARRVAQGA